MNDDAMVMMIPIVGMMIPMVIVPIVIIVKHLRSNREWTHKERMRAIETGQYLPAGQFWPSLAAIMIGAGVPVGCFGVSWLASLTTAVTDEIFLGATIVSIIAVVTGGWMGVKLATLRHEQAARQVQQMQNGKPLAFDPDAYDVVSQRG